MRAVNFDIALYVLILQSQTIHELKELVPKLSRDDLYIFQVCVYMIHHIN